MSKMGETYKPKKRKIKNLNMSGLIPASQRTPAERREMGRKGGLNVTAKRNIGQKIAALKRKGLTSESAKHLIEVLSDSDLSALDIRIYLERIKKNVTTPKEMNILARNFMEWHKTHFGITQKNINLNANVNIDLDKDNKEAKEHLEKLFGKG